MEAGTDRRGRSRQAVASTLRESGQQADAKPAREVRSLDGYDGVVLGTPLYLGALHKDVRTLLEKTAMPSPAGRWPCSRSGRSRRTTAWTPRAQQSLTALAKAPIPTPVATGVFVGAYDPARLGFKDKMIAALPASPLHGEPAHDDRDWDAIRAWAREVSSRLELSRIEA